MNQKIKIGSNGGVITLTDRQYKASGGEAAIYVHNGMVYKMYHDPTKKMLPPQKMAELAAIGNPKIIVPKDIIYDPANGNPLGYTTTFVDNADPLLKLFTRTYKTDNNISYQMINDLVKEMQLVMTDVHKAKCLIVDFNELNVLVEVRPSSIEPYFIDTDSYSTPSYRATAIMDSVRDRKVSVIQNGVLHYNPTEFSDWFSWGVLAFCLYTNIHPYRGAHPNYKPKDKQKQMDDGVSVFHPGVKTPPSVNDFKVIPKRHLEWFKDIFLNGNRSVPPLADSSAPFLVPTQIVTIKGTDKLDVIDVSSYSGDVQAVYQFMGIYYVVTKTNIYANKKEVDINTAKKTLLCFASDGTMIEATQSGNNITFKETMNGPAIGTIKSKDMFSRNGMVYTMINGKLVENSFTTLGSKIIHRINEIENVSITSAVMYDGCVIQDLLGKKYLTLPYRAGSSFSKYIPQLDGYRIVDAKSDKTVTVVIAEKAGKFDRFIIIFDRKYATMDIREVKDIVYDTINFAVMDNGLCVLLANPTELELFAQASQCEVMNNPPFDSTMKLFTTPDGIFFINGNTIHQLKKK